MRAARFVILLGALWLFPFPLPASAQEPPPVAVEANDVVETAEALDARRRAVEEAADLDPEVKKRALEQYRQALENLNALRSLEQDLAAYQERAGKIEASVAAAKAEIEKFGTRQRDPRSDEFARLTTLDSELAKCEQRLAEVEGMLVSPRFVEDCYDLTFERKKLKTRMTELRKEAGLGEVEQRLAQQEEQLSALRKELAALDGEPQRRAARRKEGRAQLVAAPELLAKIQAELAAAVAADEPPVITAARRSELLARREKHRQETKTIEAELALYDAEDAANLLRLQADRLTYEVNRREELVAKMREWVSAKRRNEAKELVRRSHQEKAAVIVKHPYLAEEAGRNTALAQEAEDLIHQIETASQELKQTQDQLAKLKKQRAQMKEKVESVGMTGPIGLLLRQHRTQLPDPAEFWRSIQKLRDASDEAHFKQFELDEQREGLVAIDAMDVRIGALAAQLGADTTPEQRASFEEAARDVFEKQREYLDGVLRSLNRHFAILIDLATAREQYANEVKSYADYIDERVLWIRSSRPLTFSELRRDLPSLYWLCSPENLRATFMLWGADAQETPVIWFFVVSLFGVLLYFGRRFRDELGAIGDQARKSHFYHFTPTLRATALTFLISIAWSGLMLFLGWRLLMHLDAPKYAAAVGRGLVVVAIVHFPLELLRQICRPHGLGESHFGWPVAATKLLRQQLRWMVPPGLLLIFAATVIHINFSEQGRDAWERLYFVAALGVLVLFMHNVLKSSGGIFQHVAAYHRGGWIDRLQNVWYATGVLAPIAIASITALGYTYSAHRLTRRVQETVWIALGLVLVRAVLVRSILLYRRKVSIQQARERRAAAGEQPVVAAEGPGTSNIPQARLDVADIAEISSQAQRLLNLGMAAGAMIGLWLVWVDVLPAINFWDRDPLWHGVEYRTVVDADGLPRSVEVPVPVYFYHLLVSVVVAAITVAAARNVPGLLQFAVLHRLPLEPAARYAITTLASYVIVIVGVVASSRSIGVGWSQVQWLAAALTFGLGFGLQEIFANFVSGLIILFERPVRVGDIVTIDNVSGVVSRIRIRATTITDWDRKEFIVPNKEFITGRLLNWTLSDKMTRVVLNVGVEYGTDVELVRNLLTKVAKEHPIVLDEPPPIATFESFGDSTLNFVLRTYLPNLDNRLMVVNDLHTSVNEEFRKAGIVIPFPQRDLHVRTVPNGFAMTMQLPSAPEDATRKNIPPTEITSQAA